MYDTDKGNYFLLVKTSVNPAWLDSITCRKLLFCHVSMGPKRPSSFKFVNIWLWHLHGWQQQNFIVVAIHKRRAAKVEHVIQTVKIKCPSVHYQYYAQPQSFIKLLGSCRCHTELWLRRILRASISVSIDRAISDWWREIWK